MRYDDWRMLAALAVSMFAVVSAQAQLPPAWESGAYVYDGAGNIKSIGADQFRYDASGRLVRADVTPGRSQSFTYDAFGSILTLTTDGQLNTFGVNSSTNRISEPANVFASYDAAGRVTTTLGGSDKFEYDALDMVTRSEVQGVTKVHLYTASGERIASVTVSGGSEVRSDWTLRDESGKVLRRLEKSGATWSWREDYVYGAGQLLAAENGTDTLHFFSDHLGTPRLITNRSGGKISAHKYLPFGDEITDPNQDTERLKFTGHERDASTLDYMHARYYFPKWGRFLSVDPGGFDRRHPQSWNRYSYVLNNPINKVDPDGREPVGAVAGTIIGFVGGAIIEVHSQGWGWKAPVNYTRVGNSAVGGAVAGAITGACKCPVALGGALGGVAGGAVTRNLNNEKQTATAVVVDAAGGALGAVGGKVVGGKLATESTEALTNKAAALRAESLANNTGLGADKVVQQQIRAATVVGQQTGDAIAGTTVGVVQATGQNAAQKRKEDQPSETPRP